MQPQFVFAPADRLTLPSSHDGSVGVHRIWPRVGFHPLANDVDAIIEWAASRPEASRRHSLVSLEQFLCWCISKCDKPLSSAEPADVLAYDEFLQNIVPVTYWVAPKGTRRNSDAWKPFSSASMSLSSRDNALSAIRSFFEWARDQGYADLRAPMLRAKPWKGLPFPPFARLKRTGPRSKIVAAVDFSDMHWIWKSLSHDTDKNYRARALAFRLAYFACLRVPDLAEAKWCDLRWEMGHWFLDVQRLRSELGSLLLFPPVVSALATLRPAFANIGAKPSPEDLTELSMMRERLLPFSESSIPTHLRKVFSMASSFAAESGDGSAARRLADYKLPALRRSLADHAESLHQRSLVRTFVGEDVLCRGSAPIYLLPHTVSRSAATVSEALTELCWLWASA